VYKTYTYSSLMDGALMRGSLNQEKKGEIGSSGGSASATWRCTM
jgi:hypothetical protein